MDCGKPPNLTDFPTNVKIMTMTAVEILGEKPENGMPFYLFILVIKKVSVSITNITFKRYFITFDHYSYYY